VPHARPLARAIVEAAHAGALRRTGDLRRVVERAHGGHVHPRRLAQVFQALRIWVNDEMRDLDGMMGWLPDAVRPGGVVVTLAYHSGEDRRVKKVLRGSANAIPPRRLPPMAAQPAAGPWEELTRRVVVPSESETSRNPRARSARLRAFRRTSA
jgi:16S rRNA (cytosine1402-N4)-methyltransferase